MSHTRERRRHCKILLESREQFRLAGRAWTYLAEGQAKPHP
jgi:hypothetical protein